ncbi:hypothetical protein SCHPADRAFT_943650 [Schizopora paradoxa]|uniref:Protein kinase domain-containing protein n=1 Tax=Schizopora paradoxa TaxID=27342 RepID=A0A0H2RD39_9AGAM|nr:hypothetical protein SCHPADRAFT_943650 [Schizopora paradoxa]
MSSQDQPDRGSTSKSDPLLNSKNSAEHIIKYPILPNDLDFETYRKTDKHYKEILDRFIPIASKSGVLDGEQVDSKEKRERTRYIMQMWPRDPNGEVMYEMPDGKMTSNRLPLWGATLYDFYFVKKTPSMDNMLTFISGSKIARWMRQKNELYAMDYIDQAENDEPEPRIIPPYHIGEFIELIEQQVHLRKTGRSMKVDKSTNEKISKCLLPPSEYPGRWPLVPFSTPTCRLQERIPFDKLPKTLIVHDPWGCLSGRNRKANGKQKWSKATDVVHTYILLRPSEEHARALVDASTTTTGGTQEAHLYITPKRRLGVGNHSYIYQAELELPRELLVKPKTCVTCSCEGEVISKEQNGDRVRELFKANKQHAPYCEHLDDGVPRPKIAKVSVTAKLTMPSTDDENHEQQLANEAWNYMHFPDHFFEHWNGYNIIRPCQDPVPVGAVVPQFYGYYMPKKKGRGFKSPILLLEHCGTQASMSSLTLEERRECWSLLERLHLGGFVHNSVYERNVLVQNGPIQWSPFERSSLHPRFRLIDFGRSQEDEAGTRALFEHSRADIEFGLDFIHHPNF